MSKPGVMIREVLAAWLKKPATENYPFVKNEMPKDFRGRIDFTAEKCIGCKLCMRDCPSSCITITKLGDKRFQAEFDLDACIYCAQCVYVCPKKALAITPDYELAQLKRLDLKLLYPAPPEPEPTEPAAVQEQTSTEQPQT